jgi:hypothetical protein
VLSTQDIDPNNPNPRRFFLLRWFIGAWHWLLPPTQAHQDRQSGVTRYLRASVAIGVFVIAIASAVFYAKPIQDTYQVWQADRYLRDAQRYLDDKDIVNAVIEEYLSDLDAHKYCDILYLAKKIKFLDKLIKNKEHQKIIELYKRSANILAVEEKKDQRNHQLKVKTEEIRKEQEAKNQLKFSIKLIFREI